MAIVVAPISRVQNAEYQYNAVNLAVDCSFWTASEPCIVTSAVGRVEVAGTDVGGVTAVIRKCPSGTAVAAGTAIHQGSFNLKGTAATNQSLTLSATASDYTLAAGDSLAFDLTGVSTSAVGNVMVVTRSL